MKRTFIISLALLLAVPFGVSAQIVRDVATKVLVNDDGSADIEQIWDANVSKGTEWYIPVENLKDMEISSFSVCENGTQYRFEEKWDVDRSREEKAGRCGINKTGRNSLELCWGLGDYGDHVWKISYHVSGMVKQLQDSVVLHYQFVNPNDDDKAPQHITLDIINNTGGPEWQYEDILFWCFGFKGIANFTDDGAIHAESSYPLTDGGSVIALVKFENGLVHPVVHSDKTFEQVKVKAFSGSSYVDRSNMTLKQKISWFLSRFWFLIIFLISVLVSLYAWIVPLITGNKYNKKLFKTMKIDGWYRQAPLEGNIEAAGFLLRNSARFFSGDYPNRLIGAYFLRWILNGKVTAIPAKKGRVEIKFPETKPRFNDKSEKDLYEMAVEASGSDMILQKREFPSWSKKNYERLSLWPTTLYANGEMWLSDKGYYDSSKKAAASEEGAEQMRHLIEFRNFLKDFTLSKERGTEDVKLWKDYLVYAEIYGIADKVAKQFQDLYPDFMQETAQSLGMDTRSLLNTITYTNNMSISTYQNAFETASQKSSGWGGHGGGTSFGGGGGFSGGGFGGGAR